VTPEPARLLEWDSRFFGRRVARAAAETLTEASAAELLDWCERESIHWLYLLAAPDDAETVRLAERHGFHLVDVRLELERPAGDVPERGDASGVVIRPATTSDLPALRAIAARAHTDSRYFHDPRLMRDRAVALYEAWIEHSVRDGFADVTLVADVDGAPAGYVTGRCDGRDASIGLIAVGDAARGRGAGTALVQAALAWSAEQRAERVTVVTQARNVAAQRLYQRAGFVTRSVRLWYHRWIT
jgi:dTDP-4-amino-4,6-dideoxy-D-galactose acyltransferase